MAKPANPKPAAGKGRKSVPWDQDPEIVARLVQVERLLSEVFAPLRGAGGHTPDQVYHALNKAIVPLESSFIKHARG